MSESQVERYINGEEYVPTEFWSLVRKYRKLQGIVNSAGKMYPRVLDEQMNALFDALKVL